MKNNKKFYTGEKTPKYIKKSRNGSNNRQRSPKGAMKKDNPKKLLTQGRQAEAKTQHNVLDTTMRK